MTDVSGNSMSGVGTQAPQVTNVAPSKIQVTVSYGPSSQDFEVFQGLSVHQILADKYIGNILGYSLLNDNGTFIVNGQQQPLTYVPSNHDQIEIIRRAGTKAGL